MHLFQRDTPAPPYHHLGLDVDDFEAVYLRAKELDVFDSDSWYSHVYEHTSGWVQMYIRDPAGNLVEIDCPDIEALPADIRTEIPSLDEDMPQAGEAARATLYHGVR